MRALTDKDKVRQFMVALGARARSEGSIFLTGGATAVLHDWRPATIDIGLVSCFHYDPYGQALAKLQRRHDRDLRDVDASRRGGLIQPARLRELFEQIQPQLIRYPAIDAASFAAAVREFCDVAEAR
jgi:hypothetical protein